MKGEPHDPLGSRGSVVRVGRCFSDGTGEENVLVVSGGISLGAYQAGATYALMHYLAQRRREENTPIGFPVATGASAGNVNAFLAALTWCDEAGDTSDPESGLPLTGPTQNLFYRTWVEIGLDRLSPDQHHLGIDDYRALFQETNRDEIDSVYTRNDALLTRNAFVDAVKMLEDTIGRRRFRSNCAVDLGITLTRSAPVFLNSGFKSRNQVLSERFVVPFHAREKEKRIIFTNFPLKWSNDRNTIGPRVAMPENSSHEIDFAADLAS